MPASTLNSVTTRERLLASGHRAVVKRGLRSLTVREVAACADGALVDEDPMPVLCFLRASVALPRLVTAVWQGPSLFGRQLSSALSHIARDRDRMAQRLDWALRGVARENSDE